MKNFEERLKQLSSYMLARIEIEIPDKIILFNKIQRVSQFSKICCKSGFCQRKLDEESILLTTFSAFQGHQMWIVMPIGLKMHHKYFKEEWIIFSKILITCVQFTSMVFLSFQDRRTVQRWHLSYHLKRIDHGIILRRNKYIYPW